MRILVELVQLLSRVPVREVRVTVRNVKPDLLHPGSQTYLVYQGPIPKLDRPPLVATVLYYLVVFALQTSHLQQPLQRAISPTAL